MITLLIYSGHKHGVDILLTKQVAEAMTGFHAITDRILIIKMARKPFNLVIIQVYVHTRASSNEEIKKFFEDWDVEHKIYEGHVIKIVMGDLNVKVCTNQDPLREVVGSHGLSSRNKPADM